MPRLLFVEVSRVGRLQGPDLDGIWALATHTTRPAIASGGIRDLEHLGAIAALGPAAEGAVVGRSLYEGTLDLAQASRPSPEVLGRRRAEVRGDAQAPIDCPAMGFLSETVEEVRRRLARAPLDESGLMTLAMQLPTACGFVGALWSATSIAVVAEVKRVALGRADRRE